ncbi:hypothetical protein [Arcticibacter eurypsychrophilus]|uniref:hypothetical protein n=1 Tax=Arcticibacter eurypsychrophilus TaxID=1434752 RepID=UPI00084D6370|nr:hypothetical protein [Arcticibacter eurypsychrophilus]
MKKQLLLLLILLPTILLAQAKKAPIKKSPVKLTEIQQTKINAQRWFKDVYIESYFKDPYSYKLLKCTIYPETYKESLKSILTYAQLDSIKSDTSSSFSKYKLRLSEYNYKMKSASRFTKRDSSSARYDQKEVATLLANHTDAMEKISDIRSKLSTLTVSSANRIVSYMVLLDCYSNNSYGNRILGKFSFYYGKSGIVRYPVQLNAVDDND